MSGEIYTENCLIKFIDDGFILSQYSRNPSNHNIENLTDTLRHVPTRSTSCETDCIPFNQPVPIVTFDYNLCAGYVLSCTVVGVRRGRQVGTNTVVSCEVWIRVKYLFSILLGCLSFWLSHFENFCTVFSNIFCFLADVFGWTLKSETSKWPPISIILFRVIQITYL